MIDLLSSTAFHLWNITITWAEILGFIFSLIMVFLNIRVIHWAWLFAIISSALYFIVFFQEKLYGESFLQIFFIIMSIWGWFQWLKNKNQKNKKQFNIDTDQKINQRNDFHLNIQILNQKERYICLLSWFLLWILLGFFLLHFTDTNVPWWDALPTSGSIVAQYLLARKKSENWLIWLVVNLISIGLFFYKNLWLTGILYCIFSYLSWLGWKTWLKIQAKQV